MAIITTDIEMAIEVLAQDELIGLPTETVYGLAGNAFSETALSRIYEMKRRPRFNPLILHVHSLEQIDLIAVNVPESAHQLSKEYWPGPLTLILEKKETISPTLTAGKDTVAVRIPGHPVALQLLQHLPFPLAAPSANPFQSVSPTTAEHVNLYFQNELKVILDGGPCTKGIESTIIGFPRGNPTLFRHGSISIEAIEKITGPVAVLTKKEIDPEAPGMLGKHYAPRTPVQLAKDIDTAILENENKNIGLLTFYKHFINIQVKGQRALSTNKNLEEAAVRLYAALHELDSMGLDLIIAEVLPDKGIGRSINDRLQRASAFE